MKFPLDLRFKIAAIANQISVRDAEGTLLLYVKQKAFKLKESVVVYGDVEQKNPLYQIKADRVLDFSPEYAIQDMAGTQIGVVKRSGMRSIWRAKYEVRRNGHPTFAIEEENPWVKVADRLLTEIPLLGLVSGYLFHPAYRVRRIEGDLAALRLVKRPAFLEGLFGIEEHEKLSAEDELLTVLSLFMVVLLERRRG